MCTQTSALKKQTSYFLFAAFALLLFIAACKKNNTTTPTPLPQPTICDTCLPPITTNGAGTFGCRVNGKVWLPIGGSFDPPMFIETLGNRVGFGGNNSPADISICMWLDPIYDTCYYKFPTTVLNKAEGMYLLLKKYYDTDTLQNGYIHFTRVDFKQGIFSGTFAFDTYSYDKNDTIHITDGRFDLHQ